MADLLLMIDSLIEIENETTDLFLGHVAERSISRGLFQTILTLLISKRSKTALEYKSFLKVFCLYITMTISEKGYRKNISTFDKLVCHLSQSFLLEI